MKTALTVSALFLHLLAAAQSDTTRWFKIFEGNIDKYPVTMLLHKSGSDFYGYYYYQAREVPVYFNGSVQPGNDSIQLLAFLMQQDNELFSLRIGNDNIAGTWKRDANARPLQVIAAEKQTGQHFSYPGVKDSSRLRPAMKESPVARYAAATVWPEGSDEKASFMKKSLMHEVLGGTNTPGNITSAFQIKKNMYFEEYRKEYATETDEELKESPFRFSMEHDERLMICYQSPEIISLAHFIYSYTGGAHGNYGTSYMVIDLRKNKKLGLGDVLQPADVQMLPALLEKNFRKTFNLKASESLEQAGLFENRIPANDNFYLTSKGIGFSYSPYEIGPYSMGEINIFIPFSDFRSGKTL